MPDGWVDVSDMRQVPDHQECWMDNDGCLLVVEILDRQANVEDEAAAAFFYKDLGEYNGITSDQDISFRKESPPSLQPVGLPDDATLCFGSGFQRVAMGKNVDFAGNPRRQEIVSIRVELCVIRLPSVSTDILISLSTPSENTGNPQESPEGSLMTATFSQAVSSFQVRNWQLFG